MAIGKQGKPPAKRGPCWADYKKEHNMREPCMPLFDRDRNHNAQNLANSSPDEGKRIECCPFVVAGWKTCTRDGISFLSYPI